MGDPSPQRGPVDSGHEHDYNGGMRVITGKVVSGKVVVEGAPLEDGATVTVLVREGKESFELTPAEEARVLEAVRDADRGDLLEEEEILRRLRSS